MFIPSSNWMKLIMNIIPKEMMIFYYLCGAFPVMKFYWQEKMNSCLKIINWWPYILVILFTISLVTKMDFLIYDRFFSQDQKCLVLFFAFNFLMNYTIYALHFYKCCSQSHKIHFIFCVLAALKDTFKTSLQNKKNIFFMYISIFALLARFAYSLAIWPWATFFESISLVSINLSTMAICLQFFQLCQHFVLNFVTLNNEIVQEVNFQSCELLVKDFQGFLAPPKLMEIKGKHPQITVCVCVIT